MKDVASCPSCFGEGSVIAIVDRRRGPSGPERRPCSNCEGLGHITEERRASIQLGERVRRYRLDHNFTVMEASTALSGLLGRRVTTVEWSGIERGRRVETREDITAWLQNPIRDA